MWVSVESRKGFSKDPVPEPKELVAHVDALAGREESITRLAINETITMSDGFVSLILLFIMVESRLRRIHGYWFVVPTECLPLTKPTRWATPLALP